MPQHLGLAGPFKVRGVVCIMQCLYHVSCSLAVLASRNLDGAEDFYNVCARALSAPAWSAWLRLTLFTVGTSGVQVSSAATDLLELTEENVEKVLDEVSATLATAVKRCFQQYQQQNSVACRYGCLELLQAGLDRELQPQASCGVPEQLPQDCGSACYTCYTFEATGSDTAVSRVTLVFSCLACCRCGLTSWLMVAM